MKKEVVRLACANGHRAFGEVIRYSSLFDRKEEDLPTADEIAGRILLTEYVDVEFIMLAAMLHVQAGLAGIIMIGTREDYYSLNVPLALPIAIMSAEAAAEIEDGQPIHLINRPGYNRTHEP